MRIALVELPARFDRVDDALADVERALSEGPPADLALLPEASLTGYVSERGDFDLRRFAEPIDGPTVARVRALSRACRVHLAAPFVEQAGGALYNAFVVASPDGEIVARYRKRHPWYPEAWATPGAEPMPVFEIAGVRATLAVCFDVHFLAAESSDLLRSVDVLLLASAWVDEGPEDGRDPILAELARSHGVTIANANWGVGAPLVGGQGGSRFVWPDGTSLRIPEGATRLDAIVAKRAAQ